MKQVPASLSWLGLLIGIALLSPASAQATALGVAPLLVCANDECQDLSPYMVPGAGDQTNFDVRATFRGSELHLVGVFDTDPFITFGATTTNLVTGPTTFAFLFGTPIVPGFYNTATSLGIVSVTNEQGETATVATSAIYPTFISGYGTVGLSPTNLGVDLGTASCVATGPGGTTVCNQGTASNTFAPTFYDNLEALLTYTQSGLGSVASWSGTVTLTAEARVPEPASLLLVASGALGLMAGARGWTRTVRRRRERPAAQRRD